MLLTTRIRSGRYRGSCIPRSSKNRPTAFYALYDKISRADILSHAWQLVRANRGSPGVDGVSFEAIERGLGVATFLRGLARDLKDKTYLANRCGAS